MSRPAAVIIDTAAFLHNLERVRAYAPAKTVVAMVKANAYGHGVDALKTVFQASDALGVSCLEEALELREAGLSQPIILMEGFFEAAELRLIAEYDLQLVLHHEEQIQLLQKHPLRKSVAAWLKLDSGMNRLGFAPEKTRDLLARIAKIDSLRKPVGLMTHFSDADAPEKTKTLKQWDYFLTYTRHLPGLRSLANSAALMAFPQTQGDWVRPGIMLYGVSPFADKTGVDLRLKPVMSLVSKLIAVRECRAGESVGYGGTWICPEATRIGVVAMGYADGYPRHAPAGTPLLVNGKEAPLAGRVSMDMLTVDLQSQPEAKVGDPVVLWGQGLPIEKIARAANTIPYELVCRIHKRVARLVI